MTRLLDKLNLRPQERRLVIFVAVVVFVALNWFFVRPFFGELGRTEQRIVDADKAIKKFEDENRRHPIYQKQFDELSHQGGQVPTEDQSGSLSREVNTHAGVAGMNVSSLIPAPRARDGRTNTFFEELALNLTFGGTGEPELVNFLYALASQNSLIRVKSMNLRTDSGRMKLGGTITLVESFQKKAPAKAATTAVASAPKAPKSAKTTNAPPKTVSSPGNSAGAPLRTNTLKKPTPAPNVKGT